MAHDHTDLEYVSSAEDYRDHEATYAGFTNMVKWSIILLAVLLVFLYVVIRP